MKTINMKRILSCLLLGAGYLLSNAQGIIVYKTDGTQIKVPYEQLDSIAAYASENGPVNPSVQPVSASDLSGEWEDGGLELSFGNTLIFSNDQLTVKQNGNVVYQGSYTLKDNVVSFVMDGNTYESAAGLGGDKAVLVFKTVREETGAEKMEDFAFAFVKKGKTFNPSKAEIQGQWLWWWSGVVRVAYKFEGDNFEIIITPWGQKYTGTYTYSGGILTLNTTAGFTSREEGTGYGSMWGDLDPVTLEGPWRTLWRDNWTIPETMTSPFIVVGDAAFGFVVLPAICTKKQ